MDDIRDVMVKIDINSSILERKIKRLAKELDDMADDRRIIKGWTDEERRELEECKSGLGNSFDVVNGIINTSLNCRQLSRKYWNNNSDKEDNQMFKDIADYFNDDAKFPEEKWYVHLINGNDESYLNRGVESKNIYPGSKKQTNNFQTQFTKQEVENINPDYLLFLEKVPVEELED
ncbi:hypothetical protein C5L30_000253 [Companilactobacillus farciminis]|uniref:DUF1642 domain-containing protein n=1 Tax=Companilactobacillus farciminis TaxID=1612 RepID=A0A4R5NJ02_9LACO|nr:hypothetical protein [Companilactobacillus farciminis]ATO46096.1 hypothetical protein LF20184_04710 [Companilactobacillus farciminis KCTC 3681 = DSM 20184]KRK62481.1 hypothetical protein FC68_GL002008 [Companilactobacillus farciminis KCTC 3681 = DSM 20184]TDG74537.1 hypothetical protein C5L30_000253 [Companilactobacillus farciminis]